MYREEHPKPQLQRKEWLNLNGEWQFLIEDKNGGAVDYIKDGVALKDKIQVPFCPQSRLSGVEHKGFIKSAWYKRELEIEKDKLNGRVFLHFGAVDYKATVYVNGEKCGVHKGGYVSFSFEITDFVREGKNTVCVHAEDDELDWMIPTGKQSRREESYGCYYTRTTGIWQTVWLEFTPRDYIKSVKLTPSVEGCCALIEASLTGSGALTATALFEGRQMGSVTVEVTAGAACFALPLAEKHLWELGKGGLYDLELSFGEDRVKSYFGLRSIEYRDKKFFLNGKSVFQRLVLDQGFYPDGIYTAPSDEELQNDVKRSMAMGFNGARLHEKVFEERFLYHADRLGYMVWGEYPNWGLDHTLPEAVYGMLPEWLEEVRRDYNHPSIVGWCPFNETWDMNERYQYDDLLALVYKATRAVDALRPCIDTSGSYHVITDIFDTHDYTQEGDALKEHYEKLPVDGTFTDMLKDGAQRHSYDKKAPFFVSEYGGIKWSEDASSWGYGNAPKSKEEFLTRLKELNEALLSNPAIFAFCYTQLTDVEQEQNGLYTYDRKAKFPPEEIYPLFAEKAAVEE